MTILEGKTFWLSECKNFGIIETGEGYFEIYYRLYSTLDNHDHMWFPTYSSARNFLKKEHCLETRMKKVSKEEFERDM